MKVPLFRGLTSQVGLYHKAYVQIDKIVQLQKTFNNSNQHWTTFRK